VGLGHSGVRRQSPLVKSQQDLHQSQEQSPTMPTPLHTEADWDWLFKPALDKYADHPHQQSYAPRGPLHKYSNRGVPPELRGPWATSPFHSFLPSPLCDFVPSSLPPLPSSTSPVNGVSRFTKTFDVAARLARPGDPVRPCLYILRTATLAVSFCQNCTVVGAKCNVVCVCVCALLYSVSSRPNFEQPADVCTTCMPRINCELQLCGVRRLESLLSAAVPDP